jgi:tetratricopeptide (TPR) repeat protein
VIRLDAEHAPAYYNRGLSYERLGQAQLAINDFDDAIRLDFPQIANAFMNRGDAYTALHQYERAIEDLNEAIRLDPELQFAYGIRALAHTMLGNDTRAKEDVDRAVELGFDRDRLDGLIDEILKQR